MSKLIIQRVRWKNFLSRGNNFAEIEIDSHRSTLIVGDNGSGKSTLLDAIMFGLFGVPYRSINKGMLVNSISEKDCVVEIEFLSCGDSYKVIRGIKPNKFEIYKNGSLMDQESHVKDDQKKLETNILGTNARAFQQVAILGSASYEPFMRLKTADRRIVIEELLGINVFAQMNKEAKARLKEVDGQLTECGSDLRAAESSLESLRRGLRIIQDEEASKAQGEIQRVDGEIVSVRNDLDAASKKIPAISLTEAKSLLQSLTKEKHGIEYRIRDIDKQIDFYEKNDQCHTCGQDISQSHKDKSIQELKIRRAADSKDLPEIVTALGDLTLQIQTYETNTELVKSLERKIDQLQKYRDELTNNKSTHTEATQKINIEIEQMLSQKEAKEVVMKELQRKALIHEKLLLTLKDTGAKAKIIKRFIPLMNQSINKYLSDFGFYADFHLDENFNEEIRSRHRDKFKYDSFSQGQKMRIDLSLLFTWRNIAAKKSSIDTNLIIFDEIFDSSLDLDGIESFSRIVENDGGNTIIITHKTDETTDKFDRVIRAEMQGNYTVYGGV